MAADLRAAILAAADMLEGSREALCELDARTGDGDHGVTMTIGARNVRRQLESTPGDDPAALVRAAAMGMAGAGGAIGPLYGRGLLAVSGVLSADPVLASGGRPDEAGSVRLLQACSAAAVEAVMALGGAEPGDKTILDALVPLRDALRSAGASDGSLADTLIRADGAAEAGADATTDMVATVGRSSRFGERSRGSPDPGARSFAMIVATLVGSVLGGGDPEPVKGPPPSVQEGS